MEHPLAKHGAILDCDDETVIPKENIIAVIQRPSSSTVEYYVHYTVPDRTPDDDSKESYKLASLLTKNLPQVLINDIKPSEKSYWLARPQYSASLPRIHVIVSTGAGTGLAKAVWKKLVRPLLDYIGYNEDVHYNMHFTTSDTSVTELTQANILPLANKGVDQSILLLSGDGGIVDIVNALLSRERTESYKKPTISLLPLGTGNAMANSSGITGDKTLGLRTMLNGSPKEVPLFRATVSSGAKLLVNQAQEERALQGVVDGAPAVHGAVVCSWGLHATLVADSDTTEYRKFGAERFKMAGKEALFPSDGSLPHAYKGRVSVQRPGSNGWEVIPRHEHGYVLATLVSHMEAGFAISPASKLLDGKLRLVLFGHLSGEEAMDVMGKAYQGGKHVEDNRVGYEEIEGLRIEFDEDDGRWRRVCIDGKIVRVEKGGWIEVHSGVEGVVDLISREE